MTTTNHEGTAGQADLGKWARNGLVGGIVAGIAFALSR